VSGVRSERRADPAPLAGNPSLPESELATENSAMSVSTVPPPPGLPEPEANYSPLSLVALGSLLVSAAAALTVVVGGLIAAIYHTPLLLPLWVLALPVATALCCVWARYRIKTSEGTLSGLALTSWGIGLSLLFGLGYSAYYAATYLAVRSQARTTADKWLDEFKKGNTVEAFWQTLPGTKSNKSRDELEIQFNVPAGPEPARGPYSTMASMDFVRFIQLGGDKTTVEFQGVDDWGWEKEGFLVKLKYKITTPYAEFPLIVSAHGHDSRNRDKPGREWTILLGGTRMDPDGLRLSPAGQLAYLRGRAANEFAQKWVQQVTIAGLPTGIAYGATLPDRELARQKGIGNRLGLLTVGGPVVLLDNEAQPFLDGLHKYQEGSLVHTEAPMFWADESHRQAIITKVKGLFDPDGHDKPLEFRLFPFTVPDIRQEGDEVLVRVEFRFNVKREGPEPPFVVDGLLVVALENANNTDSKAPHWYIKSMELLRGRTATPPNNQASRPMPPPPGR
jgi:hypothetical protein